MGSKQTERQLRYDREHTVQIKLKLNKVNDADIIDKLNSEPSKQGYIKGLIRDDINKEAGTQ